MAESVTNRFADYVLPPDFEYLRGILGDGYERFRRLTVDDYRRHAKQAVFDEDLQIEYDHIIPDGDYDPDLAVLVPHSMGNNNGYNWREARCGSVDAVYYEQTGNHLQFITFPSPNLRQPHLTEWRARKNPIPLSREDRKTVRSGNFMPMAERMLAVADKKKIGKIVLYAYSGGAPPAASIAETLVATGQAERFMGGVFFDPTGIPMKIDGANNHDARDGNEMLGSYIGSAPGFFESVMNSGSEAWADIQQGRYPADLWGFDGQIAGTLLGIISSYIANPSHIAIRKGFNEVNIVNSFTNILKGSRTDMSLYYGNMSKIARGDGIRALHGLSEVYPQFNVQAVSPGDHGTFNLLPLCTGLAVEELLKLDLR